MNKNNVQEKSTWSSVLLCKTANTYEFGERKKKCLVGYIGVPKNAYTF